MAHAIRTWWDSDIPSQRTKNLMLDNYGDLFYAWRATPSDVWSPSRKIRSRLDMAEAQARAESMGLEPYMTRDEPTEHTTRLEPALALGGWCVFCSCGNLTGFAPDCVSATQIAERHRAENR